jgi:DNA-binding NtrC family response regulator
MQILVIDDDPSVQWIVRKALGRGHRVLEAYNLCDGRELLEEAQLVFIDLYLPDGSGLDLLEEVALMESPPLVVLMTGKGDPEAVIETMKRGAMDYLTKPFDLVKLRSLVREAEGLVTREEEPSQEFIAKSPVMEGVLKRMGRLADTDLSVLIMGERGVGKGAAARYIHAHSGRREGPLLFFKPAHLPSPRVDLELFGAGGRVERARGGTLVIEDVEQLGPEVQNRLLVALERGEYSVPGDGSALLEARIIATTSGDLPWLVGDGSFNEALFLRLQTFTLEILPLRERREEILLLAEHFLHSAAQKGGFKVRGFTTQASDALVKYGWPGNVEELKDTVERLVPLARGQPIPLDMLPFTIRENRRQSLFIDYLRKEVQGMLEAGETNIYGRIVDQVERVLLEEVLGRTRGNQNRASHILGVHRNTIRRKLSVLGESER